MPGTFLNHPFDEEIFVHEWSKYPDNTSRALLDCGVIKESPTITNALANGGNYFTVPFYKALSGTPANYDGQTDIPIDETEGGSQSGVAFGRTQGWKERDFLVDFVGNDPMGHIVSEVGKFWANDRQARLIKILEAALGATGMNTNKHTLTETDKAEDLLALLNTGITTVFGVGKNNVRALVMDSLMAAKFENIGLLKFRMGTDPRGYETKTNIADMLGYTIVVDDTAMSGKAKDVYVLGEGAILTGKPPVKTPVELQRDGIVNGGETYLLTRKRDVLHPNGFAYKKPATADVSPVDTELAKSTNYSLVYPAKNILIAKITVEPAAAPAG